ncbi:MAG: hypothetical protein Q8M40_05435 [Legionella sp.]|nr:hypothetical protein [Legionella sp.]
MSNSKWENIHRAHTEQAEVSKYSEYFKEHLIEHLTKEHDPNGEKNQPDTILKAGQSSIGNLSRIFDSFSCPVPSYEQMKEIYDKKMLTEHMQEILNEVLPNLLNEDRTALHPTVINAIGNDYQLLKTKGTEGEIAEQFVKAIFVSYAQKILDNTTDNAKKIEGFSSIFPAIEKLSQKATLNGLPKISDPKDNKSLDEIHQMLIEFQDLIKQAKNTGINIPNVESILSNLETGIGWVDPNNDDVSGVPEDIRRDKGIGSYDKAVDSFVNGLGNNIQMKPAQPEEANWFIKILRFITGNEQLLQSKDEKRYSRQMEIIPKINEFQKKLESTQSVSAATAENTNEHDVTQSPTNKF